jgi:tetratricopeptide (TPR) repeat protein
MEGAPRLRKAEKMSIYPRATATLLCLILLSGCGALRTEFYRGETRYLYDRGNRAYRDREYDRALECFKEVIEKDPDYARAHAGLGNLALIRGEFPKAERCYRHALAIEPELEDTIRPLLILALERNVRGKLEKSGVNLRMVLTLLSEKRDAELGALLAGEVPLNLLAGETYSMSLDEMTRLQELVIERAYAGGGAPRCRLLYGHLLFNTQERDRLAAEVLEHATDDLREEDRRDAHILLARLYLRMGLEKKALGAFLNAVRAGMPLSEAAPHISAIYGLKEEEISKIHDFSETPKASKDDSEALVRATTLSSWTLGQ